MFALFLGNTVTFLILFGDSCAKPVVEYDKGVRYEEYIVEHEISSEQARNSTLSADMQLVNAPPGCQECSQEEKRYCLGAELINDHCCCDMRHNEVLPYIPHTCYRGSQLCQPVLSCDEYSRLRTCCCDKLVLEKWKEKFKSSSSKVTSEIVFTLILSQSVYIFVNYLIT